MAKTVKKTLSHKEQEKLVSIWASKIKRRYVHNRRHAFVEIEDIKPDVWVWMLEAMRNYERLHDSKKVGSMKVYVQAAIEKRAITFQDRKLHRAEMMEAALQNHYRGSYVTVEDGSGSDTESEPTRPLWEDQRKQAGMKRFEDVKDALEWYARYRTTYHIPHSDIYQRGYDDEIVMAADIDNILNRHSIVMGRRFTEKEKILLMQVGMDGVSATAKRLKPRVGNARRYVEQLKKTMHIHLMRAGYIEVKDGLGIKCAS